MLPTSVDFRKLMDEVRDQGSRPTCVAFALTAAHEKWRVAAENISEDLCEEFLYWAAKKVDMNGLAGTSLNSAAKALGDTGQPNEDSWPYDSEFDDSLSNLEPPALLDFDKCIQLETEALDLTLTEIKSRLSSEDAVVLVVPVCDSFFITDDGFMQLPSPEEIIADLHAVLIVGYDDSLHNGVLMIRNSWGADWGDEGYGYLPYSYFESFALDAWAVKKRKID